MKIYKSNGQYFKKVNGRYVLYEIMIKQATIVLISTDIKYDNIDIEKEYTFQELKKELKGGR